MSKAKAEATMIEAFQAGLCPNRATGARAQWVGIKSRFFSDDARTAENLKDLFGRMDSRRVFQGIKARPAPQRASQIKGGQYKRKRVRSIRPKRF
jgi:hypothetical protein